MFRNTRKKQLRNRVIAAAAGVAVMTFGIWLNYKEPAEEPETEKTVQEVVIDKENDEQVEKETEDTENQESEIAATPETYLIKEENGTVKVYLCDKEGNKKLYLITSIPYELLSESDQQLFKKGVTIDTEDDLGKFLENFDS